jgi:hypothetical protein
VLTPFRVTIFSSCQHKNEDHKIAEKALQAGSFSLDP